MKESGYYPPGAEHDPHAPYNEPDDDYCEAEYEDHYDLDRRDEIREREYDRHHE